TNPEIASVNVQTRISKAISAIPAEVNESGITVMPRQSGVIMTINLYSDHQDTIYNETFLQAYAQINLMRPLLRVDGVAQVSRLVTRDDAMRLWSNHEKLALYTLIPKHDMDAIKDQNSATASGRFSETSGEAFDPVIKHKGRLSQPGEIENIV